MSLIRFCVYALGLKSSLYFPGLEVSQLKRLKKLDEENRWLKTLVADRSLDQVAPKAVIEKTAGADSATRRRTVSHRRFSDERTPCLPTAGIGPLQLPLSAEAEPQRRAVRAAAELATQHPRYGYRRLGALLGREGRRVNHKKLERLYRQQGLAVQCRRRPKRLTRGTRPSATALERVLDERPQPQKIRTDNGPEFRSRWFQSWCHERGIRLDYIEPGKPMQNGIIEPFNGRLRDECLHANWFPNLRHARLTVAAWRSHYNQLRPHSALGYRTPNEFLPVPLGR